MIKSKEVVNISTLSLIHYHSNHWHRRNSKTNKICCDGYLKFV